MSIVSFVFWNFGQGHHTLKARNSALFLYKSPINQGFNKKRGSNLTIPNLKKGFSYEET